MEGKDFLASRLRKQVGLEYEDQCIWLKKCKVVAKPVVCKSRTRKPAGKIAGYTTLVSDSPNNGAPGCFNRRVFLEDENGIEQDQVYPGVTILKDVSIILPTDSRIIKVDIPNSRGIVTI